MNLLINIGAYQGLWLANILGAAHGLSLLGPVLLLAWLPLHLTLSHTPRADARLLLVCVLFGTLADAGYMAAGWIEFSGYTLAAWLPPLWISALWASFALTLNHALRFLHGHPLLASLLGGTGAALAYGAGVRLGAARVPIELWQGLGGIALVWFIACPLLLRVAARSVEDEPPGVATSALRSQR